MEAASAQSAAVAAAAAKSQSQSQSPSPPMAQPDPGPGRPPVQMTTAELEAAIAALPAKKDALREAFDRLAACSPFPLPFTWEDLDAHISSLQSSISLRFRQLRVLEAVRPAPAVSAPVATGDDEKGKNQGEEELSEGDEETEEEDEEVVEEEVVVVEVDEEEVEEEQDEEVEVEEEEGEEVEVEEEDDEEVEVEEEEDEEEVDANNAADKKEQKADEEMQEADEEEVKVEEQEELEANDKEQKAVKEGNAEEEQEEADEEMQEADEEEVKVEEQEELEANDKEQKAVKEGNAEEEQEEADDEMGEAKEEQEEAKKLFPEQHIQEEKGEAKMSPKQGDLALQGADKDLVAACARMDAARLVEIVCKNMRQEYPVVMRYAPDPAALVLRVVRDFLPNKEPKTNKVWENCVGLIRSVPVVTPKLHVHIMEQAKQLAEDWKKMIDKPGSCGELGMLASWALLCFLIYYNIVSEFDVDEIIRLFGTIPRKYQKKSCMWLCKGLGLDSRITDLIDYLIRNGQHLSVIQITRVLNLVDKYPLLSLLEGYVENAKYTALELLSKNASHKSLNLAISKEVENLWTAHTMAKQQRPHSSQWSVILAEIKNLLAEYKKNRSLNALTSNAWQQQKAQQQQQQQKQKPNDEQQKNKKRKKEQQQHEGQGSQLQGKHRKLQRKQEQQQTKPQEKQQQQQQQQKPQESKGQQQHKPQDNKGQQQHNPQEKQQKQQQQNEPQQRQQQHLYWTRPCITKLPTPVVPAPGVLPPVVPNMAHIGPFGHPPVHSYPAQPGLPGIQGGPFTANAGAPQYNPYQQNPLYRHPSFYPR